MKRWIIAIVLAIFVGGMVWFIGILSNTNLMPFDTDQAFDYMIDQQK